MIKSQVSRDSVPNKSPNSEENRNEDDRSQNLSTEKNKLNNLEQMVDKVNETNELTDLDILSLIATFEKLLYDKNEEIQDNLEQITNLTNKVLTIIKNNLQSILVPQIISSIEKLFYIFLLHFHITIVNNGYRVLKFLLNYLDYEFHKDTLQTLVKMSFILKAKRKANQGSCGLMINNIAFGIIIILHSTNVDNRKMFIEFVKSNSEDYGLIYQICGFCSEDLNFSKMYTTEAVLPLIDIYTVQLDKGIRTLGNLVSKNDLHINDKNKIKSIVDFINCICKIMEAFITRGNKVGNYDKAIKTIVELMKQFWNFMLHSQNLNDIEFAAESIHNIILFCDLIGLLNFELLLVMLNWNSNLLMKNPKYLHNEELILYHMSNCTVPPGISLSIANDVLEIIEKILSRPGTSKDPIYLYYIVVIIDSLQKFPENSQMVIKEQLKKCNELMNSLKSGSFIQSEDIDEKSKQSTSFAAIRKEYKDTYIKKNRNSNSNSRVKETEAHLVKSLIKFQDFKDSLKSIYKLESTNLLIDNKITNFIDKEKEINPNNLYTEHKVQEFAKFYSETSTEMFKEIFKYK